MYVKRSMKLFTNRSGPEEWLLDHKDWGVRRTVTSVTHHKSLHLKTSPAVCGQFADVSCDRSVSYRATTLLSTVGHLSLLLGVRTGPRTSAERTIRTGTPEWAPASECTAISLQREVPCHLFVVFINSKQGRFRALAICEGASGNIVPDGGRVVVEELCVLQVLCQTHFAPEFLHCSVCIVNPVLRVGRLPKFVLVLGPEIS